MHTYFWDKRPIYKMVLTSWDKPFLHLIRFTYFAVQTYNNILKISSNYELWIKCAQIFSKYIFFTWLLQNFEKKHEVLEWFRNLKFSFLHVISKNKYLILICLAIISIFPWLQNIMIDNKVLIKNLFHFCINYQLNIG